MAYGKLLTDVIDDIAPMKTKIIKNTHVPYMNASLRKAIFERNKWRNKHFKYRKNKLFRENYRCSRNKVVKLNKVSLRKYFDERCGQGVNSKSFYKTIKPFLSDKGTCGVSNIILKDNVSITSDPTMVAAIFNDYYASIANINDSGDDGRVA